MEIKIPYASNDKKTAYESAKTSIPVAVEKFGVKADVKFSESDYTIQAKGTGFDAKIQFQDKEVVVNLDLSFLLKPLKSKIVEVLEKQIKRVV